ncbi:hypothetical protein, partial [Mesorhizobium sp. WSM4887]|uniref:hypothetical protein n=1 Tax=Mesorhizobium sp. WSM4887 TaxID=3038543 RepID=UPI0024175E14
LLDLRVAVEQAREARIENFIIVCGRHAFLPASMTGIKPAGGTEGNVGTHSVPQKIACRLCA